jgi:hypothetical protein
MKYSGIYKIQSKIKPDRIYIGSVSILQFSIAKELIREWESTLIASKELKLCKGGISNALTGRAHTSGGFIWRYKKIA